MRRFLLAGLALPLLAAPAFSQSTTTPPATQPGTVAPMAPRTGQVTPATPAPMTSTTPGTTPSTIPGTMATPAPTITPGATSPSVTTTAPTKPPSTTMGLAPGANSFTEAQARTRLIERGYTAVSELKKDKDGVWRGMATKDAKSVAVGVDYKGDISGG